jgi:hypothetical protein
MLTFEMYGMLIRIPFVLACCSDENLRNYFGPVILMFRPGMETRRQSPRTLMTPYSLLSNIDIYIV